MECVGVCFGRVGWEGVGCGWGVRWEGVVGIFDGWEESEGGGWC